MTQSFALIWSDLNACANRIRATIELLLDSLKISRTQLNKKRKRYNLRLHDRLLLLQAKSNGKFKGIADTLLTIKLIGNDGSHSQTELTRSELLDCYELLEDVFEKLYENKEKRLIKIQKRIKKKRGKK